MSIYSIEKISSHVWKIVENDVYKQYPFCYVVETAKTVAIIDSCCGLGDIRKFIESKIPMKGRNVIIIATHVHSDHIGGLCQWCREKPKSSLPENADIFSVNPATSTVLLDEGVKDICMGSYDKNYSSNYTITSLVAAFPGMSINPFVVTRWLKDNEKIILDPEDPLAYFQVIHTPGHSMDSICLWFPKDKRIFVGDIIYPYLAVHVELMGSNVALFRQSLEKLNKFIKKVETTEPVIISSSPSTVTAPNAELPDSISTVEPVNPIQLSTNSTSVPAETTPHESSPPPQTTLPSTEDNSNSAPKSSTQGKSSVAENPDTDSKISTSTTPPPLEKSSLSATQQKKYDLFLEILNLSPNTALFDATALLALNNWDIESSVALYLTSPEEVKVMFPPGTFSKSSPVKTQSIESTQSAFDALDPKSKANSSQIKLSCGHVNPNLDSVAVSTLLTLLNDVDSGKIHPLTINSEFGYTEYMGHNYHVILSNKPAAHVIPPKSLK